LDKRDHKYIIKPILSRKIFFPRQYVTHHDTFTVKSVLIKMTKTSSHGSISLLVYKIYIHINNSLSIA